MAVEIIPKRPEAKGAGLSDILFYALIVLFIITVGSYFGLNYLHQKKTEDKEFIKKELEKKQTQAVKDLEKQVLSAQKKINDFSSVFTNHTRNTTVFAIVEKLLHPKVLFTTMTVDPYRSRIAVAAKTDSFEVLGQQIKILESEKNVSSVVLSGITVGREGETTFNLEIALNPQIFKEKTEK